MKQRKANFSKRSTTTRPSAHGLCLSRHRTFYLPPFPRPPHSSSVPTQALQRQTPLPITSPRHPRWVLGLAPSAGIVPGSRNVLKGRDPAQAVSATQPQISGIAT